MTLNIEHCTKNKFDLIISHFVTEKQSYYFNKFRSTFGFKARRKNLSIGVVEPLSVKIGLLLLRTVFFKKDLNPCKLTNQEIRLNVVKKVR